MKKIITLVITLALMSALAGCGKKYINSNTWDADASSYKRIEIWNPEEYIVVTDENTIKDVVDNILGKSYLIGKQSDVEGFMFMVNFCQYNNEPVEITILSEDSIIYDGNECKLATDDTIDIEYLASLFT